MPSTADSAPSRASTAKVTAVAVPFLVAGLVVRIGRADLFAAADRLFTDAGLEFLAVAGCLSVPTALVAISAAVLPHRLRYRAPAVGLGLVWLAFVIGLAPYHRRGSHVRDTLGQDLARVHDPAHAWALLIAVRTAEVGLLAALASGVIALVVLVSRRPEVPGHPAEGAGAGRVLLAVGAGLVPTVVLLGIGYAVAVSGSA